MNGESGAFPSRQDDQPGITRVEYFAAHAPFSLDDVPVTKQVNGQPVDLTEDERIELLVTLRLRYARRMAAKARRPE